MLHDCSGVGHDPFAVDLVPQDHAVGDGAGDEGAPGGAAQVSVLRVPTRAGDEVRGVETVAVIALPDDMGGHAAPFGKADKPLDGIADNILAVVDRAGGAVEDAVVRVVAVDQADVAFIPDLVGAADNVIHDVGVNRVKSVERLGAGRAIGGDFGIVAAFHLHHALGRGGHGGLVLVGHVLSVLVLPPRPVRRLWLSRATDRIRLQAPVTAARVQARTVR